jgi:hypothetical protein
LEAICSPEKLTYPEVVMPDSKQENSISSLPTATRLQTPETKTADAYAQTEAVAIAAMWKLVGTKYNSSDEVMAFMGKPYSAKPHIPCTPKAGAKAPEKCVEMRWLDGRAGRSALVFWRQVEDTPDWLSFGRGAISTLIPS